MKGLPELPKPAPLPKSSNLPDGTIALLVIVYVLCTVARPLARQALSAYWAEGIMGMAPLAWLVFAVIIIKPHRGTLTKKAADQWYLVVLLGFVGQLAAVVVYVRTG